MSHLKITSPSAHPSGTKVELDGEPLADCRSIDLHMHVDDLTTATLELYVSADFDGEVRPVLSEETQSLLKRLGWTPPAASSLGGGP